MKTTFYKSIFGLMLLALTLGCSGDSDSSTPCTSITCLNGGVSNANCGCNCPAGFSGSNCSTPITPSKISITKVRVTMFPNYDGAIDWDIAPLPDSSPDIAAIMGRQNGSSAPIVIWSSPTYYLNAVSSGSNFFDWIPATPIEITQVTTPHVIELFDYDSPSPNDMMGTIAFYPYVQANGFPTTIQIIDNSIPLRFELTVSYTW